MILLVFSFLAGIVTILSPCVLPLLPVLFAGSSGARLRPWGIIVGFIASFTIFTLSFSLLRELIGLSPDMRSWIAGSIIGAFGLVLLVPVLKQKFVVLSTTFSINTGGRAIQRQKVGGTGSGGFFSGMLLGAGLGLVWTPCAGPIMAGVLTATLNANIDHGVVLIVFLYSLGTSIPMVAIIIGGRSLFNRLPFLKSKGELIQRVFGGLMVLTAIAILTGADRMVQVWALETFPSWGEGLRGFEANEEVGAALEERGW